MPVHMVFSLLDSWSPTMVVNRTALLTRYKSMPAQLMSQN